MVILESRNIDPGKDSAFLCLFAAQSTTLGFFLFFLSSPFLLCLCVRCWLLPLCQRSTDVILWDFFLLA